MTTELEIGLYIFILAGFLGYHVITRVPPLLHTPLMSATNAISGISLVGSLVAAGGKFSAVSTVLGLIAVTAATINIVGGFLITDRMLKMFKSARDEKAQRRLFIQAVTAGVVAAVGSLIALIVWWDVFSRREVREDVLRYIYVVSAV